MEQVKGVTYPLKGFLGPPTWLLGQGIGLSMSSLGPNANNSSVRRSTALTAVDHKLDGDFEDIIKENPDNDLYHCVIYLAPGDYHGFHSPAEWDVSYRRHFPGMCVVRWLANTVMNLLQLNSGTNFCTDLHVLCWQFMFCTVYYFSWYNNQNSIYIICMKYTRYLNLIC